MGGGGVKKSQILAYVLYGWSPGCFFMAIGKDPYQPKPRYQYCRFRVDLEPSSQEQPRFEIIGRVCLGRGLHDVNEFFWSTQAEAIAV